MTRTLLVLAVALLPSLGRGQAIRPSIARTVPPSTALLGLPSGAAPVPAQPFTAGALALAGISPLLLMATSASAPDRGYASGAGTAISPNQTKLFAFSAHLTSPQSYAAVGHALLIHIEQTRYYGDFVIAGPVRCLYIVGNRAVIGLTIQVGTGTAATHIGESFYIYVADGGLTGPDKLDNSGYTNSQVHNCAQGTGNPFQTVIAGNILVW